MSVCVVRWVLSGVTSHLCRVCALCGRTWGGAVWWRLRCARCLVPCNRTVSVSVTVIALGSGAFLEIDILVLFRALRAPCAWTAHPESPSPSPACRVVPRRAFHLHQDRTRETLPKGESETLSNLQAHSQHTLTAPTLAPTGKRRTAPDPRPAGCSHRSEDLCFCPKCLTLALALSRPALAAPTKGTAPRLLAPPTPLASSDAPSGTPV